MRKRHLHPHAPSSTIYRSSVKCSWMNDDKESIHIYTMGYYLVMKKQNHAICTTLGGAQGYYASEIRRQINIV